MCVVSMVVDHYWDKWKTIPGTGIPVPPYPNMPAPPIPPRMPTQEDIDEFHKLLERAREYDKKNNQPDCEVEAKKQRLMKLAEELGISIRFD